MTVATRTVTRVGNVTLLVPGWDVTDEFTLPEGVLLIQTCSACPEQYDVFFDQRQIGYLRLRHGYFSAQWPDVGGECVYDTEHVDGDGCFGDDRQEQVQKAVEACIRRDLQERR